MYLISPIVQVCIAVLPCHSKCWSVKIFLYKSTRDSSDWVTLVLRSEKQLSKVVFACFGLILISRLPAAPYPALAVLWVLLLATGGLKMLESFTASKTAFALPPVTFRNILLLNLPIVALAESWIFNIHLDLYQWIGVFFIMLSALSAIFSGEKRLKAL